ncbi:MAG: hypothetical protein V3S72_11740 [Desulfobacterales bacterium]
MEELIGTNVLAVPMIDMLKTRLKKEKNGGEMNFRNHYTAWELFYY